MFNNDFFKFDDKLIEIAREAENTCSLSLAGCDKTAEYNGAKVLSAFIKNRVSEQCLHGSTGYGYGDVGRDTIEKIFAEVLGAEDSLVRNQFISGTYIYSEN